MRVGMRGVVSLAAELLLCAEACGDRPHWEGDPDLFGVDLVVAPEAASCARASDARSHVRRILDTSSRYFGHDPTELEGLRIVLVGSRFVCPGASSELLLGCYFADDNTIAVSTSGVGCLESSYLPHELLHYLIGDPDHTDPRWSTLVPLWQTLQTGVNCN